jgi:hypothetical protein
MYEYLTVTLTRVREPLVSWQSNECYTTWVCVFCNFRHPACNAHEPYCYLWPSQLYSIFPHSHKLHDFRRKKSYWKHNVCFDFICNVCLIKNVYGSSCKVLFILVRLKLNKSLLDRFYKNPQISTFMKIRPVGAQLFHGDERTDRRTDMPKLTDAFRNFAKAPKKDCNFIFLWFLQL